MEYSEQFKKFGFKLPVPFCLDVLAIQPDFFTRCVAPGALLLCCKLASGGPERAKGSSNKRSSTPSIS